MSNTKVNHGIIAARGIYSIFEATATYPVRDFDSLSAAEKSHWIAMAEKVEPGAGATHVDPATGKLYNVNEPGHEDGTIGVWVGYWANAETSSAFEAGLVKLYKGNDDDCV